MKRHLRSHKKTCKYCYQLFNLEMLYIHESICNLKPNKEIEDIKINSIQQIMQSGQPEDITFNETNLAKKLKSKKQELNFSEKLSSEDLNLLTSNIKHKIIENRQKNQIQPLNLNLKPWQQSILELMTPTKYDNRTIYVLHDPIGGIGKTTFKHYVDQFPNYLTISGSAISNLYHAYQKLLNNLNETNWNVIIDLPRSTYFLPSFIEQIKDKTFPAYNYYQTPLLISNANIFIFCNELNLLKNLSKDRLKIYNVKNEKLVLQKSKILPNILSQIKKHKSPQFNIIMNYCKKIKCEPDCIICKKFMCIKCKQCIKCKICKCNYICINCKKFFITKLSLERHMINCNKQSLQNFINSSSITITICKICEIPSKDFVCKDCLKPVPHLYKYKYECKYCKIFVYELDIHLIQNHI